MYVQCGVVDLLISFDLVKVFLVFILFHTLLSYNLLHQN